VEHIKGSGGPLSEEALAQIVKFIGEAQIKPRKQLTTRQRLKIVLSGHALQLETAPNKNRLTAIPYHKFGSLIETILTEFPGVKDGER
jgi:hypothetical protein